MSRGVGTILALVFSVLLIPPGCGGGDGPGPGSISLDSFADSENSRIIRATVRNKDNQMMEGVLVNFSTTAGAFSALPGDDDGNPYDKRTNANGIADVKLELDDVPVATVTATASASYQDVRVEWHESVGSGTISASLTVTRVAGISPVSITATQRPLTKSILVRVYGANSIPLPNVPVRFTSTGGQFLDGNFNPMPDPLVRSDQNGLAMINLTSPGSVVVTAIADNTRSPRMTVEFP